MLGTNLRVAIASVIAFSVASALGGGCDPKSVGSTAGLSGSTDSGTGSSDSETTEASTSATATTGDTGGSDLGAPCNHGTVEPPESKLITFPALSCDELYCVYADEGTAPAGSCVEDAECNSATAGKFECHEGACRLSMDYVLERSMCSHACDTDVDCLGMDPTTNCQSGFSCARLAALGEFCCQKLCVCNDDLSPSSSQELDASCASGTQEGCCTQDGMPLDPPPSGCGVP